MSEERHASFPAPKPPPTGSDGAIEIAIEEGEPEVAEKPVSSKAPETVPSSQRVGEVTAKIGELRVGETTVKRSRAKVTLKIPDDEISRPQLTPSSPPAKASQPPPPEAPMVPMTPMRIISIEPPPVSVKPAPPAPVVARAPGPPASSQKPPPPVASPDDSWTPYQPTVADRTPSVHPPVSVPRPARPPSAAPPPQPPAAPPRPSYHSAPGHPTPLAAIPVAPPTSPMPPAPPTQPHGDSMDDIAILTDEPPPPSSGEIEIDEDARPTKPAAVLNVPEPKLVPTRQVAIASAATAPASPPLVELASVHTAVTPVASPVALAAAAPSPSAVSVVAPAPPAPSSPPPPPAAPIAPSPTRVIGGPPASASQPQVSIKDLPPMRSLAPTEPEGLEVHFEDEDPPVSSPRASEPEAEIAAEDLVSVESAPGTAKQVGAASPLQTETPARAFLPVAPAAPPPQSSAVTAAARGSLPPPPGAAKAAAAQKAPPRVIVPTSSPLAPPPMSESAPTGRRKARPWWEELFNDDFIRTMAKISDAQIAKEVDFVEESLAVAKGAMLLDLACGTGRHAIELTRRGYKVVGFDLSLPMLAKAAEEAQERSQKLNFVQGDMREMTFEDTFDGIYCWNTSFGFFEEEKNAQVVQRVHKALKKGGQFMLEVGNRDYIIRQAPSLAWFEGDGCICMDEMSIDWITSRMKVKRTMMMDDGRTKEIDYSVRIYSLHELGKVLHEAGFRVAEVSGRTGTPGVYFGSESPRTMILAEKK